LAVAESQGIESEWLPRIATGLCSGLARTGGPCGALNGAILALNLLTGRAEPGASVDRNYERVRELIQQYEARFGSSNCQTLTGVHLGTPEGQAAFREKNQIANCLDYVEEVTRIVLTLAENED
jgi:C_GCAxxG_C_C family probable redox protein